MNGLAPARAHVTCLPPASPLPCFTVQASLTDIDLQHNQLTGPAFPPAWLAPNSTLNLLRLQLNDNPGLEGTLPASLSWSRLENL